MTSMLIDSSIHSQAHQLNSQTDEFVQSNNSFAFHFKNVLEETNVEPEKAQEYMKQLDLYFNQIKQNYVTLETQRRFLDIILTVENESQFENLGKKELEETTQKLNQVSGETESRNKLIDEKMIEIEHLSKLICEKNQSLKEKKSNLMKEKELMKKEINEMDKQEKKVQEMKIKFGNQNSKELEQKMEITKQVLSDVCELTVEENENVIMYKSMSKQYPWTFTMNKDNQYIEIVDCPFLCDDIKKKAQTDLSSALAELAFRFEGHARRVAEADILVDQGLCQSIQFFDRCIKLKMAARRFITLDYEMHYDATQRASFWLVSSSTKAIEKKVNLILDSQPEWTLSEFVDAYHNFDSHEN